MTQSGTDSERFHALDTVRAFALLSGIVLHAAMTFMPGLASFGFPVDRSPSDTLQIVFYVIHIFRMTLFFVLAGFFTHLIFHRKGPTLFLRERMQRILVPFILGWLFFGPLTMVMIYIALAPTTGDVSSPPPPEDFPLGHLWFLYYLMLVYAGILSIRWIVTKFPDNGDKIRAPIDRVISISIRKHFAAPILAIIIAMCLVLKPDWMLWEGIASPDTGLLPQWSPMGCFGLAFAFGWLLHRQNTLLSIWKKTWGFYLVLAAGFTGLSWWLVSQNANPLEVKPEIKLTYALCYALSIWCWVFAFLGAAQRLFNSQNKIRRYIADASYWMYLAHLPVVFALQMLVLEWPLHWSIKFPLIVVTATAILLLSYHFLVRNTYIGEILNGRRYKNRQQYYSSISNSSSSENQADCIVEIREVYKQYGTHSALNGLNLQIRAGEVLALLGPNGAGKSTTISCLLGLQKPDEGIIKIFGSVPQALEVKQHCGVMLQEVKLPPELRVRELIELTCSYYSTPMPVDEVLRLTRTTSIAKQAYGKLSGGQQRLAQFAIAVCGNPKLLFLDEPTVGLDIEARQALWTTLRQLVQNGSSIVLTTHYLEEAETLADRVALIVKGKIVALGTVDEIRARVVITPVTCITRLDSDAVAQWQGVTSVQREGERLLINTSRSDEIVRRLSLADPDFRELKIGKPGLSEAFTQITQEFTQ